MEGRFTASSYTEYYTLRNQLEKVSNLYIYLFSYYWIVFSRLDFWTNFNRLFGNLSTDCRTRKKNWKQYEQKTTLVHVPNWLTHRISKRKEEIQTILNTFRIVGPFTNLLGEVFGGKMMVQMLQTMNFDPALLKNDQRIAGVELKM